MTIDERLHLVWDLEDRAAKQVLMAAIIMGSIDEVLEKIKSGEWKPGATWERKGA